MVKLWLTKGKLRGNQLGASQPSQESEMHASHSCSHLMAAARCRLGEGKQGRLGSSVGCECMCAWGRGCLAEVCWWHSCSLRAAGSLMLFCSKPACFCMESGFVVRIAAWSQWQWCYNLVLWANEPEPTSLTWKIFTSRFAFKPHGIWLSFDFWLFWEGCGTCSWLSSAPSKQWLPSLCLERAWRCSGHLTEFGASSLLCARLYRSP